jgi:Nuclear condensing complex subunits, C-term domain
VVLKPINFIAHGSQLFPAFLGSNSDCPRSLEDPCAADCLRHSYGARKRLLEKEGSTVGNNSFNLISMLMLLQRERIIEFFLQVLETEKSDKVQALLRIGLSKLVLSGMISEDKVGADKLLHDIRR